MKIPLLLCIIIVVLKPAFLLRKSKRQSDFWDNWGEWKECSRTCGGGVSFRERQCYSRRADGGSNCIGPTKNYRSCNVQECTEGSRDIRAEQCSEYDGMEFQGKRYKWLPYYGASNKCELNCIPKGENFYYRHKMAVLDGTPCEPGRKDICIEGVCKSVGCDNILDSSKREDMCLVCGGDGRSCYEVKGQYESPVLSKGYSQLFTIPFGATSIQIKEVVPTRNFLAIKNVRGEYYLNGYWTIEFSRAVDVASTVLHYYRGTEGDLAPEVITARGPTTEPLVVELIGQEANQGVQYEYYLPNQDNTDDYQWSYSSWSECSAECGGGYQTRLVFCTIDYEAYPAVMCKEKPAPSSNRTCNRQPCPQMKRWKENEWGPCSATCGGGTQSRSVYCVTYEGRASQNAVPDADCAAFTEKPATQQVCNLRACAKWSLGPWTACSTECGEGIQKRTVSCTTDSGAVVPDITCLMQMKPPDTQLCYGENCIQEIGWHIGEWGLCSKSCNSGIRKRQVICADNDRNFYEPETCEVHEPEKPSVIESCNMQPCHLQQQVSSMQDTWGYDNSDQFVLTRYNPEGSTQNRRPVDRQNRNEDNSIPNNPRDCRQNRFGCCPDGVTEAKGYDNEGCPQYYSDADANVGRNQRADPSPGIPSEECRASHYGCCFDNTNKATGPVGEGCRSKPSYPYSTICLLPSATGPCADWSTRWYFVPEVGKCNRFWYGSCHGNKNNFATEEECMSSCRQIQGSSTGNVEYRYRNRGMKWDRLTHIHSEAQGEDMPVEERRDHNQGMAKTLDQDLEGRDLSGHSYEDSRMDNRRNGDVTERHGTKTEAKSSPHSSVYSIILDKVEFSSMVAFTGQNTHLPCRVSDYPFPNIEWLKDGHLISRSSKYSYNPDGSLVISSVRSEDTGVYKCLVSNGNRKETHRVQLQVKDLETQEAQRGSEGLKQPDSSASQLSKDTRSHLPHSDRRGSAKTPLVIDASLGHRTRLPCLLEVHPSTNVEWQKDGNPLSSTRHRKQADGSLTISRMSPDDAGIYTCTATTGAGRVVKYIQLNIRGELKITGPPSSLTVSEGEKAELRCVVSGQNANIQWSRNGLPVRSDWHHTFVSEDGTLIIRNTKATDEGSYTCNAYNGAHSVSASADIRVHKSRPTDPPLKLTERHGECIDHPDLANCDLVVYASLCSNEYYSSFCCASCSRH
ncbi:papilin isoform X2 [Xenopus laevis]|uniref:Papilin n=1 Tax=Xenopus laevis TaxID=8355 RepID=A0A8J1LIS6_XENLA|nr:papilin isoform X2 [Xenopus laevis]